MVSAFERLLEAAEKTNLRAAKYWGVGIAGLIGVFIVAHWTQKLWNRYVFRSGRLGKAIAAVVTPLRRSTKATAVWRTSILTGRLWLAMAYLAINLACAFTNVNWEMAELFFAKRMGWYALSVGLCCILADKKAGSHYATFAWSFFSA